MVVTFALSMTSFAVALAVFAILIRIADRPGVRAAPYLSGIVAAAFLYAFGYGLELAGDTVAWVRLSYLAQHLGIAFAPAFLLALASRYGGPPVLRARATHVALFAVAAAVYLIVVTGAWHGLYHADARMIADGPLTRIAFERGPVYDAYQVYMAALVLTANAVLGATWLRARGRARAQARTLFVASIVPWLGGVAYVVGLTPWGLDATPFALAVSAVAIDRGVRRHALADVRPIARDLVVERIHEAVVVVDVDGRIVDRNPAAAEFLQGLENPDVDGSADAVARYPRLDALMSAPPAPSGEGPEIAVGARVWATRVADLPDPRGERLGRVVVAWDETRQVETERALRRAATTDALTGLANRASFLEIADREVAASARAGRPTGVAVFDLDDFKAINDRYGHATGDEVLRVVAHAARTHVRDGDLVGRLGGEEFGLLLPGAGLEVAHEAVERVRAAVRDAVATGPSGEPLRVTGSFGVAAAEADASDASRAVHRADQAMYRVKRAGGDAVAADDERATGQNSSQATGAANRSP